MIERGADGVLHATDLTRELGLAAIIAAVDLVELGDSKPLCDRARSDRRDSCRCLSIISGEYRSVQFNSCVKWFHRR